MLLTDLNIDCLESILEYLELTDLCNVADSNKRLNHASKFIFIRKYGSCEFRFSNASYQVPIRIKYEFDLHIYKDIYIKIPTVTINDPKNTFQILRLFGKFIFRIDLCDSTRQNSFTHPDHNLIRAYIDYINEFCCESLNHLTIGMRNEDLLQYFRNVFTEVKCIYLKTEFSTQKNSLIKLFPNLQRLTFYTYREGLEFIRSKCLLHHFPCLEFFKKYPFPTHKNTKDNECIEIMKGFLQLNPQLKYFFMPCRDKADINILRVFEERNQNVQCLDLFVRDKFFQDFNGEKLHLHSVKHLRIRNVYISPFTGGIGLQCKQLEKFVIRIDSEYSKEVYDFIEENPSIKTLHIDLEHSSINFSRVARSLPLLQEFEDFGETLSEHEVIHVLSLFKLLKLFRFKVSKNFDCKQLNSYLNIDWSIHNFTNNCGGNDIILKRNI